MKILVIGGTRFVGLRLVWKLTQEGHDVTILNRGKTPAELPENIKRIFVDRRNHKALKKKLLPQEFDAVFDISGYKQEEVETVVRILSGNIGQYIFCSTASVYQQSYVYPIQETFSVWKKKSPGMIGYSDYGYNKVCCEDFLLQQTAFSSTILRPMYIYGPYNSIYRERYFFDRIKRNLCIFIPGWSEIITQFGHVDDLADAFIACLGNNKAAGKIYNISGTEYISLDGLVKTIGQSMEKETRIVHYDCKIIEKQKFDYHNPIFPFDWEHSFFVDITSAKEDLNWSPKYSLLEGMKHTYKWYETQDLAKEEPNVQWDNYIGISITFDQTIL